MKNIATLLFLLGFTCLSLSQSSDRKEKDIDQERVEAAVIKWADSTFKEYNEPRFEKYRANYTDEYLIASMRVKSINRRISELRKEYTMGTYSGSEQEFTDTMEDLKKRKKEAQANNQDFHPKVTNYVISFWANILLDSGVLNYVQHKLILDDDYNVIRTSIIGSIGDNSNAKIVYR